MSRRTAGSGLGNPFSTPPVTTDPPPSYQFFSPSGSAPPTASAPARSATQRASYQPPRSSAPADGLQRAATVNPTPGQGGRPLQRSASTEDRLATLRRYDVMLLLDDSASMAGALWQELVDTVVGLVERAVLYDTDGLDIQMLCDPRSLVGVRNVGEARELLQAIEPRGESTPTEMRVEELLSPYVESIERAKQAGQPLPKPLCLICVTDGSPDDPDTLAYVLKDYAERLDAVRAPITQLGIQFIQIGNDAEAASSLQALDDDMAGSRDIIDTVRYPGTLSAAFIEKSLLGAINRRADARSL